MAGACLLAFVAGFLLKVNGLAAEENPGKTTEERERIEEEAKGQRCENILYEEAGRQPADHQIEPEPEVTALKNQCVAQDKRLRVRLEEECLNILELVLQHNPFVRVTC